MEININEKTFIAPPVKARMVRRAVEIAEKTNFSSLKVADLDNLIDFVVDAYGKQFTRDDMYDGIEANQLVPSIVTCIQGIVGTMSQKLDNFPNAQPGT